MAAEQAQHGPVLSGALRDHPVASKLAAEVRRVHRRYAVEVVGAFALCPFMKDPNHAFGRFCVILDPEPRVDEAVAIVCAQRGSVHHLVYPLVTQSCAAFEGFAGELIAALRERVRPPPVHAVFHPEMEGDTTSAARLVGWLRRAPDPFVQLIPAGLHEGGTVAIDVDSLDLDALAKPSPDRDDIVFERTADDLEEIGRRIREIRLERDRRYRRFLAAMI